MFCKKLCCFLREDVVRIQMRMVQGVGHADDASFRAEIRRKGRRVVPVDGFVEFGRKIPGIQGQGAEKSVLKSPVGFFGQVILHETGQLVYGEPVLRTVERDKQFAEIMQQTGGERQIRSGQAVFFPPASC